MLKHRQDGLVSLHGTILLLLVTSTFLATYGVVESLGLIKFASTFSWRLYLVGVLVSMIWIHHGLSGAAEGLRSLTSWEAARLTGQQLIRIMVVLFTLAFTTKDVAVSRAFLESFLGLAGAILFAANRWLPGVLATTVFHRQRLRTLVVASGRQSRLLREWLAPRGHLGVEAVGCLTPAGDENCEEAFRLGTVEDLRRVLVEQNIDQVVFSQTDFSTEQSAALARIVEQAKCRVRFFVNMDAIFAPQMTLVEHNDRYAFAAATMEPLDNPLNRVLKRALDIAVALPVVAFVLPPLTAVVWLMQRWQSPGPVFYKQLRSGLNRERFYILKFRTMSVDSDRTRARQATQNDSRVFAFGRFLRRTSLDEIPQFINVVMGVMSVSGPRPHLLEHDEEFAKIEHFYYKRHFVKPGITGLAQSMGFRGELLESSDLTNRVRYDEIYVANWSLRLDLRILVNTVRQIVLPPRSAY